MPLITKPARDDVVGNQALNGKLSYLSAGNPAAGVFIAVLLDSSEGLHYLISQYALHTCLGHILEEQIQ